MYIPGYVGIKQHMQAQKNEKKINSHPSTTHGKVWTTLSPCVMACKQKVLERPCGCWKLRITKMVQWIHLFHFLLFLWGLRYSDFFVTLLSCYLFTLLLRVTLASCHRIILSLYRHHLAFMWKQDDKVTYMLWQVLWHGAWETSS